MRSAIDGYTLGRELEPPHPRCTTSDPVYEATDRRNERVAVKLLTLGFPLRDESRAKWVEAMARARAIASPHAIAVSDAGFASDGRPYYAMPFVEGETIASAVDRGMIAAAEQTRTIIQQLGAAAAAATAAGCVPHLHTRHVLLAPGGARAWNFGVWPWRRWAQELVANTYTNGGHLKWHPNLTPLEARGVATTPANAAAQLALIAFSMLTARHYWVTDNDPDGSPFQVLTEILGRPREPPSARTQIALPAGFDAWFLRCVDGGVADAASAAQTFP